MAVEIYVRSVQNPSQGKIYWASKTYPCALGRAGIASTKVEGDGVTPIGRFAFRELFYRPDRQPKPITLLNTRAIAPEMGWSDDPTDPGNYNRLIMLPYDYSHERLWRDDHVYDLIIPLGYNDDPAITGKGSAIFLHLARPGLRATEGCVAVELAVMLALLSDLTAASRLIIE